MIPENKNINIPEKIKEAKIKEVKSLNTFFGKLLNFLRKIKHEDPKYYAPIPRSYSYINAGDVLSFDYRYIDKSGAGKGDYVTVLVVSTERGDGIFTSTKNNKLLSCFILDTTSESVLSMVLSNLHDKKISYKNVKASLSSIFGSWNFRTYDLSKIRGLQKIKIDKDILEKNIESGE